jgi:GNAT superfamily N-acetyltransferase
VGGIEVRRIRPDDDERLRAVRLAALADTPSAFAGTHAVESALPVRRWEAAARDRSRGASSANFLAIDRNRAVGIVGAFRPDGDDDVMNLVSMWVEPAVRGTDVADGLVAAVVDFSIAAGCRAIELWVTVGNDRARRFYERDGFVSLDEFKPLPSDPCKDEVRMRRAL